MQGDCYRYGHGVRRNLAKAVHSYKKALISLSRIAGTVRAHHALGCMYKNGEVVPQYHRKALEYKNFGANIFYHVSQWKVAVPSESRIGIYQDIVRTVAY